MTHICVGKLTIIGSDNGLSPGRRQAIIWTNAGILLIGPLGTNFSEILIEIHIFSFKKMHLKMSSGKWRPFCLGLIVLIIRHIWCIDHTQLQFRPFHPSQKSARFHPYSAHQTRLTCGQSESLVVFLLHPRIAAFHQKTISYCKLSLIYPPRTL